MLTESTVPPVRIRSLSLPVTSPCVKPAAARTFAIEPSPPTVVNVPVEETQSVFAGLNYGIEAPCLAAGGRPA